MTGHVLVTGATGFVGRRLCAVLEAANFRVRASRLRLGENPQGWLAQLEGVACVVHLAARVHRMRQTPQERQEFQRENANGTRFVAELAARSGVRRIVFASSIKVNGEGGTEVPYSADDAPDPQDAYARSKWLAEQSLREICESNHMEWVVVRSPLVYGPGVKANFHRLMRLAHSQWPLPLASIRNRRNLIGISNLADFLRTCVAHPAAAGRVWLVADDEALSTPELIMRLATLMHRRARLFPAPGALLQMIAIPLGMRAEVDRLTTSLLVDARPVRDELKWRPVKSVDEELRAAVDQFIAEAST